MIARATGLVYRTLLSPAELREGEVHPEASQGPVPACLMPGYQPPPVVIRLPEAHPALSRPEAPAPPPALPVPERTPPHRREKAPAAPSPRRAIAAHLAGGVWRTAREIASATGLRLEVVRVTLRAMRAQSRGVLPDEIEARDGLLEYAVAKEDKKEGREAG